MEENNIKALISLLDDDDSEILNHVEEKIYELGTDAVPFLESAWEDNFSPKVQKRVEDILHKIQYESVIRNLSDWKQAGEEDLVKGLWILATYLYPDYELSQLKKDIEQLYYDVWLEFRYDMHPFDQIKVMNGVFFGKQHFRPNTKNFHAPNNSMINMVLENRRGNPITLSVVYMLLAQKLNLPIFGVNLPNQFILTYKNEDMQFYISPFNKGLTFSRADIDDYVAKLNLSPAPVYYEPCSNTDIITRIVRNLIISYDKLGDSEKSQDLERLLKILE